MTEKDATGDMMRQRLMPLGLYGLIVLIIGVLIIFVPGMPFRGSGAWLNIHNRRRRAAWSHTPEEKQEDDELRFLGTSLAMKRF